MTQEINAEIFGLQPGQQYSFQVRSITNDQQSPWSESFVFTIPQDTVAPDDATSLTANFTDTTFIATWSDASPRVADDFKTFKVEIDSSAGFGTAKTYYSATPRFEMPLEVNRKEFTTAQATLYIRVKSVDTTNNESTGVTTSATNAAPSTPTGTFTVTGMPNSYLIDGAGLTGKPNDYLATVYTLYSASTGGVGTVVFEGSDSTATIQTTTYTQQWISARYKDQFGQLSAETSRVSFTPLNPVITDTTPPAVPASVTSSWSNTVFLATFPKSTSADTARYLINLTASSTLRTFSLNATGEANQVFRLPLVDNISSWGTAQKTISATVQAVDAYGNTSAATTASAATYSAAAPAVSGAAVAAGNYSYTASWTLPTTEDYSYTEVAQASTSGGALTTVWQGSGSSANLTATSIKYVKIRHINVFGDAGTYSSEFAVTPLDPVLAALDGTPPAAVTSASAAFGTSSYVLTFTKPVDTDLKDFIITLTSSAVDKVVVQDTTSASVQTFTLTPQLNAMLWGSVQKTISATIKTRDKLGNIQTAGIVSVGAVTATDNTVAPSGIVTQAQTKAYSVTWTKPTFSGYAYTEVKESSTVVWTGTDTTAIINTADYAARTPTVYHYDIFGNVKSIAGASVTPSNPTPLDTTPPASVTSVTRTWTGQDLVITFNKPADTDLRDFVILLTDGVNPRTFTQVADPNTTSQRFLLTYSQNVAAWVSPVSTLSGTIKCRDNAGNIESTGAAITSITATDNTVAPTITVGALPSAYSVTWPAPTFSGYAYTEIQDSSSAGGTYTTVWTGTTTSAVINRADYTIRYVKVRHVDVFGRGSAYTAASSVTPINPIVVDTTAPAAPTAGFSSTSAVDTKDKSGQTVMVTANWTGVVATDLTGYKIKFSTVNDSSAAGTVVDVPSASGAVAKSGIFYGVADQTYYWWVASYDQLNNTSAWSATQTVTATKDTTAPAVPTSPVVAARPSPENNVVVLSWTIAATQTDFNPATGIGYYEAMLASDSGFTANVQTARSLSNNAAFTVPLWSTTYYTKVRSVDSVGNASAWTSNVSSAVGADPALAQANTATTNASTAQTTANGKNTIFYAASTSIPTAIKAGDIWFVTDQDYKIRIANAAGGLIGNWPEAPLGNSALASAGIDAGKLTVGTLDAGRISAGSLNANKITAGTITADRLTATTALLSQTLQVGDTAATRINIVAGATGAAGKIYSGNSGVYNNANTGFYLDGDGNFSLEDKLSFNGTTLTVAGTVNASAGNFTGYVTANSGMRFGKGVDGGTNDGIYIDANDYWYGNGNFSLGNGNVTWNGTTLAVTGNLTASTGSFTGNVSIGASGSLYVGSPTTGDRSVFNTSGITIVKGSNSITADAATGTLTANSVNLTGAITATSGSIASAVTIGGTAASTVVSNASTGAAKPEVFRQIAAPSVSSPVGSIWYDTDDSNKTYVLVAGSPNVWTLTEIDKAGISLGSVQNLNAQGQAQTGLIAGTTITGGGITLSAGGSIKGGQTAYNTGTGFFLGYESAAYRFSIGNGSTSGITWDGTTFTVGGNVVIGSTVASTVVSQAANAATSSALSTTNSNVTTVQQKTTNLNTSGDISGAAEIASTGSLTLAGGSIKSGKAAYGDSVAGFILEYNGGTPRVEFSNAARTNYLQWTGSALDIKGEINADTGNIGGTTGWTIAAGKMYSGSGSSFTGVLGGTGTSFFAGATDNAGTAAKFKVTAAGALTSTSGTIGGVTIAASSIYSGTGTFDNADTPFYLGSDGKFSLGAGFSWDLTNLEINGNIGATSATFKGNIFMDSTAGSIYSGTISGSGSTATITGNGYVLNSTGLAFYSSSAAKFAVTSAGVLTATSGTVGGWTMAATTLTGTNMQLTNTGVLFAGTTNDSVTISAADATYRLWAGNSDAASAAFSVTKAGALVANSATIKGAITATSGVFDGLIQANGGNFSGNIYLSSKNILTANQSTATDTLGDTTGFATSVSTITSDATVFNQGARSLKIVATDANAGAYVSSGGLAGVPIDGTKTYTVSAYVKSDTITKTVRWIIYQYIASGAAHATASQVIGGAALSASWTQNAISYTPTDSTVAFIRPRLYIYSAASVAGDTFYADQFSVNEGASTTWQIGGASASILAGGTRTPTGITGQRVELTSTGLAGYDASNNTTFSLPSSGSALIGGMTLTSTGMYGGVAANYSGMRYATASTSKVFFAGGTATDASGTNAFEVLSSGKTTIASSKGGLIGEDSNFTISSTSGYITSSFLDGSEFWAGDTGFPASVGLSLSPVTYAGASQYATFGGPASEVDIAYAGGLYEISQDNSMSILSPVWSNDTDYYWKTISTTITGGTSGGSTITVSSATGIQYGDKVSGTGIAYQAWVTDIASTTITLSHVNTGTPSGTVTFTPQGPVKGVSELNLGMGQKATSRYWSVGDWQADGRGFTLISSWNSRIGVVNSGFLEFAASETLESAFWASEGAPGSVNGFKGYALFTQPLLRPDISITGTSANTTTVVVSSATKLNIGQYLSANGVFGPLCRITNIVGSNVTVHSPIGTISSTALQVYEPKTGELSATGNLFLQSDTKIRMFAGLFGYSAVNFELDPDNIWKSATLVNSWANYGSGYANAEYRKMPDGTIRLRGLVQNTGSPTTTIFALPSGHRPSSQLIFSVLAGDGNARIDITSGGAVSVVSYGSGADSTFVSLSGISFDTM